MALAQPITISQQANFLQLALDGYANPLGGEAKVVSNIKDYWAQAKLSSQKPAILICYQGDISRGPFEQQNCWIRVDRQWSVAVIRGRGFTSNRGDTLNSSQGGQIPFYDVVEQVRETIRTMLGISEELPTIDFKAIKPMSMGQDPIDAYEIQFSTANDLPMILLDDPNLPAPVGATAMPPPFAVYNGLVMATVASSGTFNWAAIDQITGKAGAIYVQNGLVVFVPNA